MAAENVALVISDVDGVHTDGTYALNERGEETKRFSVADGLGVRLLQEAGIEVGFLSGRRAAAVRAHAERLGVRLVADGVERKRQHLEEMLRTRGVPPARACYVGDDLVDLPCLALVGFPVAVANARDEVKRLASFVTQAAGGHGAFREVAEHILRARGLWDITVERYR